MKYIYLDQNQWVLLANGGHNGNEDIIRFIKVLKEKILNKEIIIFISLSNVLETMKRKNEESRDKLWNFMLGLSGNNTMCPFSKFLTKIEARNVFHRRIGIPELDIKKWIFRKGISGLLGMKSRLENTCNIPKNVLDEMLSKVDSFETLKIILSSPGHIQRAKLISKQFENETSKFNSVRDNERSQFKDKNLGNIAVKARYFSEEVFPVLAELNKKFNLPPQAILKEGATKEEAESLIQEFPSTYTYVCLTDRRDRMRERKIDPHDMNDIFSLSTAIPYCDIVFGEKMFLQIAKQAGLDRLYQTKLVSSLEEFKKTILNAFTFQINLPLLFPF